MPTAGNITLLGCLECCQPPPYVAASEKRRLWIYHLKYAMMFSALLRVVRDNQVHFFEDPELASTWLDQRDAALLEDNFSPWILRVHCLFPCWSFLPPQWMPPYRFAVPMLTLFLRNCLHQPWSWGGLPIHLCTPCYAHSIIRWRCMFYFATIFSVFYIFLWILLILLQSNTRLTLQGSDIWAQLPHDWPP